MAKKIKLIKKQLGADPRAARRIITNEKRKKQKGAGSAHLREPAPVKNGLAVQKAQNPYLENGKTRFNLRNTPGVYLVYQDSKLVYVGFSGSDVYKAMYRHFQKWTDKNQQRITFKDLKNITVRMVYTKTGSKARMLEGALILKHKPPLNINQYDGFITDESEKKVLHDFETANIYTGTYDDDNYPF